MTLALFNVSYYIENNVLTVVYTLLTYKNTDSNQNRLLIVK